MGCFESLIAEKLLNLESQFSIAGLFINGDSNLHVSDPFL